MRNIESNSCLSPEALHVFINSLDQSIIDIVSETELVILATEGAVRWIYLEAYNTFCIDGILSLAGVVA